MALTLTSNKRKDKEMTLLVILESCVHSIRIKVSVNLFWD